MNYPYQNNVGPKWRKIEADEKLKLKKIQRHVIVNPLMPGGNKKVQHTCVIFLLLSGIKGLNRCPLVHRYLVWPRINTFNQEELKHLIQVRKTLFNSNKKNCNIVSTLSTMIFSMIF